MKLALVSAKYPFGGRESYLHVELQALAPYFEGIVVYPASPETAVLGYSKVPASVERRGLFAFSTVRDALLALASRPRESICGILALLSGAYFNRVKLKNVVILMSGLALGFRLRRERFQHVHSYWLSTPASIAYLAARVAGITWSSTGHLWDIYENNALAAKLSSARFVRVISARGRRDLLKTPGCANANVVVLHVGVDLPAAPPALRSRNSRPFALLCAANLVLKKGHANLISALEILSTSETAFHCTLAGAGDLRAELESQVNALGLAQAVTFRGHVQHNALLDEMRAGMYDAMVLPSIERSGGLMEGIPVALMEAMALGLPVISTATGSIEELVDNDCGRVVPQGDAMALADAISELASDPDLCARLAYRGYEKIASGFNVREVAKQLAKLICA